MSTFIFDNAMVWAQIRLRGGWKNLLFTSLAYGGLAGGTIFAIYESQTDARSRQDCLDGASAILALGQVIILLLMGASSVSMSIRQDLVGRQIESHRMMPLSPLGAVVGYLVGSTSRVMGLAIMTLLLGIAVRGSNFTLSAWYAGCAVIFGFAIMIWSIMALAGFISRAATWFLVGIFAIILFSNFQLISVAPGLSLLCGFTQLAGFFSRFGPALHFTTASFASVAIECLITLMCILAAARRYARPAERGLPLWFGMGIFTIWIGAAVYGIVNFYTISVWFINGFDEQNYAQDVVSGTLCVTLVAGMLVMGCLAVRDIDLLHIRRALGQRSRQRHLGILALVIAICAACCGLISKLKPIAPTDPNVLGQFSVWRNSIVVPYAPWQDFPMPHLQPWPFAALTAIFLLQVYLLMRIIYPAGRRPNLLLLGMVIFITIVPLVVNLIYRGTTEPHGRAQLNQFGVMSVIGCLIEASNFDPKYVPLGIAFQLFVLVLIAIWFKAVEYRRSKREAAGIFIVQVAVDPTA